MAIERTVPSAQVRVKVAVAVAEAIPVLAKTPSMAVRSGLAEATPPGAATTSPSTVIIASTALVNFVLTLYPAFEHL
ncbi:hypothetical protein [Micromonospora saelicesensis]|uniref:hypothetical protein n=1 Tax=Micromonospora saelicesensis TaxID=285676 RepID=UPI0011BDAEF6|nr:hypothetical protein [Micromonospora saelicesensis]